MEPFIEGGYPYQFVDKPLDLLICKICQLVSQDPYETTCCHNTFCQQCIDTADNHGYTSCPICRHYPIHTTECVQLRREIESLRVYCDNKNLGCDWIGGVEAIKRHMKQCPYCVGACEYHIVGCNIRIPQHMQTEHNREKAEDHIFLVQQKMEELDITKVMLNQASNELNSTKQELKRSKALLDVATVELQLTKAKLQDTTEKLNVSQGELHNTNEQLNESMDQLGRLQDEADDVKGKLADSEDQVNHTIKELLCTNQKLEVTENELAVVVSSLKQIKSHIKNKSYEAIKLVALSTKIPFEARVVPTIFKMPQYTEKKENNLWWYSDPFYTDDNGYKMCLRVSPGGDNDGKGTHLSVALCLMDGPHDHYLAWPLRERFKITILNWQLEDDYQNHSRIITYDDSVDIRVARKVTNNERGVANLCTQFISHSNVHNFLIDDGVYFKVQIDKITASSFVLNVFLYLFCYPMLCYFIVYLIGMTLLQ